MPARSGRHVRAGDLGRTQRFGLPGPRSVRQEAALLFRGTARPRVRERAESAAGGSALSADDRPGGARRVPRARLRAGRPLHSLRRAQAAAGPLAALAGWKGGRDLLLAARGAGHRGPPRLAQGNGGRAAHGRAAATARGRAPRRVSQRRDRLERDCGYRLPGAGPSRVHVLGRLRRAGATSCRTRGSSPSVTRRITTRSSCATKASRCSRTWRGTSTSPSPILVAPHLLRLPGGAATTPRCASRATVAMDLRWLHALSAGAAPRLL